LRSPEDSFVEAPRATPFGLARLSKIYLQERYQIEQVIKYSESWSFFALVGALTTEEAESSPGTGPVQGFCKRNRVIYGDFIERPIE
jgi:hypothetical protein